MKKALKEIPEFRSEAEEREFWLAHDSTEYVDYSQARSMPFSSLQPSKKTISLRLSEEMLSKIKILANQMDVPYQSLMKMMLSEKIKEYGTRRKAS